MKKIFILLTLLLSISETKAQSGLQLGLRFNPEFTGYSNSNDAQAGDEQHYASHFTHLSFGAGAIYNFNTKCGIGVDILFSREGQAYSGTFNGKPVRSDTYSAVVERQISLNGIIIAGDYVALAELNYIKVPIMFSLTTDNTQPFFLSLMVGPQIEFLHGVAQEVNAEDLDYPNSSVTPADLYNSVTLSGVLAVGASYNVSSHWIFSARLRFDYGFTDAEKKDVMVSYSGAPAVRFYSTDRSAVHSETAGLLLGVDFKL
jgi:hypothetical protein